MDFLNFVMALSPIIVVLVGILGFRQSAKRVAPVALIWTLVLVAYFIISFNTGAWYITWVIFLIGGSIQSIVSLAYSLHKDKNGR